MTESNKNKAAQTVNPPKLKRWHYPQCPINIGKALVPLLLIILIIPYGCSIGSHGGLSFFGNSGIGGTVMGSTLQQRLI